VILHKARRLGFPDAFAARDAVESVRGAAFLVCGAIGSHVKSLNLSAGESFYQALKCLPNLRTNFNLVTRCDPERDLLRAWRFHEPPPSFGAGWVVGHGVLSK
jgi:hypothetical protein